MRYLIILLSLSFTGSLLAQLPVLSATSSVVSNTTWSTHRDITPIIYFGGGTGPNGYGNLAWASLAGDPSLTWNNAQAVSVPSCLSPFGQTPIAGTTPIWSPRSGCSTGSTSQNDVIYTRPTFTCNKVNWCGYYINIKADNNATIYVNGQYVGSTVNNWGTGSTFNITNFLVNGTNVVAIQVSDDGITGWMSCRLYSICT